MRYGECQGKGARVYVAYKLAVQANYGRYGWETLQYFDSSDMKEARSLLQWMRVGAYADYRLITLY